MSMRECIRSLELAKKLCIEFLSDKENSTKNISDFLKMEIGQEWKKYETLNLLNLFDEIFCINGFNDEGTIWGVTPEVWKQVVLE